ncbi:MAG: DUF4339 domain-containing protein, partial [Phycisphaerales bacterium]|nr:DUF4339 domain-containing protein [Phycisphaerales bacterium]
MAEQEWYYAINGRQLGPVDIQVLRQLLSNGNLQPVDLVWRQGMDNWQPAVSVAELNDERPAVPPAYPVAAMPAPYGTPLPYATPATNSQGRATTAFVISLLGFFCFGIVLGPIS